MSYSATSWSRQRARRGKQSVTAGNASSGVKVSYTKSRRELFIAGWYDHYVGIESAQIGLTDFLDALGISDTDLRAVLRERELARKVGLQA